ncbi:MAG: lysine exporter LysO family protein [Clostridiales bacterium]|nr:lysine exporter LysO family protein [Clostridiales bacterium]
MGYYVGARFRGRKGKIWDVSSRSVTLVVFLLVFVMGSRIGGDERVLESLGSIGINAFILTIATFIGSILMVTFARKLLGINREGKKV